MNSPKPLIVIIEDEKELAGLISDHLERTGMKTLVCHSAAHAMCFLERNFANLLLIDLGLPDSDGFTLVEELKQKDINIPIIFVTGSNSEADIIRGLTIGGDDYITKPFSYAELVARIQTVLRRSETAEDQMVTKNASLATEPFDFCGATVNPQRLEVEFPNGNVSKIGRKDFGILSYLSGHKGRILTRKSLIHAVWGIHADVTSRSIDQYIVKIRDNFTQNGCDLSPFNTIHGVGYIYDPENIVQNRRTS
ncbi:MAG TPA: response regulator transcription factor [Opitutales bacterium]|nr:response regulator transcription factor [Opitutales bacterium]